MSGNKGRQAREQARVNKSIFAPHELKLDDGSTIMVPPHPNLRMFDDDALAELDQYHVDLESCDREDDIYIPEQIVKDRDGNEMKLPAETKPGPIKQPYRRTDPDTGEVTVLEPYQVTVAKIALGPDYEKLRAGTINGRRGSAADVWRVWNEQGADELNRAEEDPKS